MLKDSVGIIPIFVSHMGCPNDCVFCNQKKINGTEHAIPPGHVRAHVLSYLETMQRDRIEIAFYGGSFTGIDWPLQEAYLNAAYQLKVEGKIHRIRLSTRPDYLSENTVLNLKTYGVDLVELGCQSFDADVLSRTKRGHTTQAIYDAVEMLKKYDLEFGIQLMLGLPGDHFETFMYSVEAAIKLKPDCVRIYPTLVIKDTELSALYHKGLYVPLTLQDATLQVALAMKRFYAEKIKVIRVGLQSTDLIDFDSEVEAGPFHPAFGERVMSFLFFDAIRKHLETSPMVDVLEIQCHPKRISTLIGDKGHNIERIKTLNGCGKVVMRQNSDLMEMTLKIVTNSVASEIDIINE